MCSCMPGRERAEPFYTLYFSNGHRSNPGGVDVFSTAA